MSILSPLLTFLPSQARPPSLEIVIDSVCSPKQDHPNIPPYFGQSLLLTIGLRDLGSPQETISIFLSLQTVKYFSRNIPFSI